MRLSMSIPGTHTSTVGNGSRLMALEQGFPLGSGFRYR
jgi:hypothetical protein